MTPELKPCPFCGASNQGVFPPTCREEDEYDPKDNAQPVVRCYTCFSEAMGKNWDHSMKSAVVAWNRRADMPPTIAQALALPEIAAIVAAAQLFVYAYKGDDDRIIEAYYAADTALAKVRP